MKTREKIVMIILLAALMCLPVSVQALDITFHLTGDAPTPGYYDVNSLVGAVRDGNNVGTTDIDGAINDATTYAAFDRGHQGQFFVTPSSEPVFQITGFWYRHCGYTENGNQTWWVLTGGTLTARVTNPACPGTPCFVMNSETYSLGGEPNNPGTGPSTNGTGTWVHAVFDTPVPVGPGMTYGIDMGAASGAFYEILGIKDTAGNGNPYPDGTAYVSGASGVGGDTYTDAPGDRVFIVELIAQPPLKASVPFPIDCAGDASQSVNLSWVPGLYAAEHVVYFGTNFSDVNTRSGGTYQDTITESSYLVSPLTPGETYYWCIDEVNGVDTWPGDVWTFTVTPTKAWAPSPYDGEIAVFTDPCTPLSWNPGSEAAESQLYFGTSPDSLVWEANIPHTGLQRYNYNEIGLLDANDYYWRVNEVNGTNSWPGDIWHFTTIPEIPVTDPNLVGWWKFDEGPGKAIDWSGLDQHGTAYGTTSSAGYEGDEGSITFDGLDDYVSLPIGATIASLNDMTIAAWVNYTGDDATQRIFDFGNDPGEGVPNVYMYLMAENGGGVPEFSITTSGTGGEVDVVGSSAIPSGWRHMAIVIDADNFSIRMYLDGQQIGENASATLTPGDMGDTNDNNLGKSKFWDPPDPYFEGSLDDFRIYNKVLTVEDIRQLVTPSRAWVPEPPNASTDVKSIPIPTLTWLPGRYADKHDVYFGKDFNDVNDATRDVNLGVLVSQNQDACSYDPPVIDFNTTYYWRIDEVNMSFDPNIFKGDIWSFTTANYIVIDNFDPYSDRDDLRTVWKDGYFTYLNGSNVTISTEIDARYPAAHQPPGITHEGTEALQFVYDNDKDIWIYVPGLGAYNYSVAYYYSEMEATIDDLECVSDWTTEGVKMLSLQFSGDPDNDIGTYEQMYIALEDSGGDIALLKYGDSNGEDVNNLLSREWTEWAIDLQEFEDANASFDITDVNKVYIGLGERLNNHTAGGSGVVYIDSIRLDWAKCVPVFAPAGDLSGDCTIDLFDFIQLIDSLGAQPSTAVPIIDIKADNYSAGTWLNTDGSLGGQFDVNFFDINDNPTYETVDGLPVVTFDGNDYMVSDFNAPGGITGANDFAVIMKVFNPAIANEEWIMTWARRDGPAGTTSGVGYGTNMAWGAVVHWNEGGEEPDMGFDGGVPAADMWHEIAVTYSGITEKVLVNGKLNAAEGSKILDVYADDPVVVGAGYSWDFNDVNDPNDPPDFITTTLYYSGSVNRIRLYDEALSQAQLEYIMTGSYSADLNGDGEVDFKDLAMLLDEWWLKQKLFP